MGKLTTVLFLACFLALRLLGQAPSLQIDVVTQNDKKSLIIEWLNNPDAKYEVYGASSISDANWEKLAELPQTDGVRGSYELPTQNGIFSQFFYISEIPVAPTPTEDPFTIPGLNLEMKPIPAGTFVMGSPNDEEGWDYVEGPQTTVTITKPFWLGKTEVTQTQWKAVMGNTPSSFKGDDLPVEQVSWNDAVAFCEKLNEMNRYTLPVGYHYTLPTEVQWEYACRAGTTTRFYYGDTPFSSLELEKYAWHDDNSSDKTHTVGEKLPNDWGLYDMHGNVHEWCLDWYDDYAGGSVSDPQGPQSGTDRVFRGGSWSHVTWFCRSAHRGWFAPDSKRDFLGFRVALSPVPSE